jgi:DNA modification methylase
MQQLISKYSNDLNKNELEIMTVYDDIPSGVQNGAILNVVKRNGRNINNIGIQPGKYIPELPRWAIKKYSNKNQTVLDPFCGSGTTLVESVLLGRNAFGIDYNPIARLLSKMKSTPLDLICLKKNINEIVEDIFQDSNIYKIPEFKGRDFWFDKSVNEGLSVIKYKIELIEDEAIKDFFLATFSETVRIVSHCAPGQILLARRKEHHPIKNRTRKDVIKSFSDQLLMNYKYMSEFVKNLDKTVTSKIIGNDARNLTDIPQPDIIVTSPPYINAIDYIWANRLRLHWLELVESDKDRLELYSKEIGTERIKKNEYKNFGVTGITELDQKIKDIFNGTFYKASGNQNILRSRVVYKYFKDMNEHLKQAYLILPDGGYYCMVIGDSKICKVKIPTSIYLTQIAENIGFIKEMEFRIILKNRSLNIPRSVDWADVIEHDILIVFKK